MDLFGESEGEGQMNIKIEKGVPLPTMRGKYAFLIEMEVGDCVFLKGQTQNVVASATTYYEKADGTGKKFTCRTVEGGVRIWRIK